MRQQRVRASDRVRDAVRCSDMRATSVTGKPDAGSCFARHETGEAGARSAAYIDPAFQTSVDPRGNDRARDPCLIATACQRVLTTGCCFEANGPLSANSRRATTERRHAHLCRCWVCMPAQKRTLMDRPAKLTMASSSMIRPPRPRPFHGRDGDSSKIEIEDTTSKAADGPRPGCGFPTRSHHEQGGLDMPRRLSSVSGIHHTRHLRVERAGLR